ncbi:hypothetical protein BC567DRAFT_229477 [Phyllosticta citribraziliensis]
MPLNAAEYPYAGPGRGVQIDTQRVFLAVSCLPSTHSNRHHPPHNARTRQDPNTTAQNRHRRPHTVSAEERLLSNSAHGVVDPHGNLASHPAALPCLRSGRTAVSDAPPPTGTPPPHGIPHCTHSIPALAPSVTNLLAWLACVAFWCERHQSISRGICFPAPADGSPAGRFGALALCAINDSRRGGWDLRADYQLREMSSALPLAPTSRVRDGLDMWLD